MAEKKLNWSNVITVTSAMILIGSIVFGAAFAGGWAAAILLELGGYWTHILQGAFCVIGVFAMIGFLRGAERAEPFYTRD
ncbi:hypothetical protein GJW-30_1_02470 [Variibacter gotjawalensis]|uniref:Uncharacterized protein n=1 Tax=Variibacter gotjawalensis TaxID=1333996 RepID=A0A0S3PVG3_9BRAD|nr:hypothetical protein [Variibacter gotjawalensis]NIK45758.1 amino acid transporter [Variibacter gotjawalensis]RZS47682.1 hypothetical protein EV661_0075 [Variibacter gotjawalensis]BAT59935.1 hypothetical protein GJW-30_1_02470 [Variibacter gotjawalensis]